MSLLNITPVVIQVSTLRPSALIIPSLSCDPVQVKLMLKVVYIPWQRAFFVAADLSFLVHASLAIQLIVIQV